MIMIDDRDDEGVDRDREGSCPDSRIPRRFARRHHAMMITENATGCRPTNGMAEPMLATPEAVDTATVRM